MSTLKVNTINAATSGQAVAVDISNPRSFRNLIINGAMQVAQRGTSSTASGYNTVDRFRDGSSGNDEAPTYEQADVASGTTPFQLGFRKCLKITNGNQTGGAGASDRVRFEYRIEAQDIANSGWNYTSSSSYITLSFWVKSSVAQNFYARIYSYDGTPQTYSFETGSLSANTWTKVTKKIPGNSNLQFDNNNDGGMLFSFAQYAGSDYTDAGHTMNTWAAYSGTSRYPTNTSTWYTTNDATWEFTGMQLEVGSYATDFEHRSYAEELNRCLRYFYAYKPANTMWRDGYSDTGIYVRARAIFPVPMRTAPSATMKGSISHSNNESGGDSWSENPNATIYEAAANVRSASSGRTYTFWNSLDSGVGFHFDAEL